MGGRAGGQIFRDVLRRKLNAETDSPNYDDQGQEMTWDEMGYSSKTKEMRRPNPDGTFDGPSGGRPMSRGEASDDLKIGDINPANGKRISGYAYADSDDPYTYEGDGMHDDQWSKDWYSADDKKRQQMISGGKGTGRPGNDGFNSTNPFIQATADAGGDEETMQAVLGAAEQMGMNGVPIEQMMAYDAELDEGGPDYVFKSPEERKAMLQEAYQRGASKAKNNMNKNMGKPFR